MTTTKQRKQRLNELADRIELDAQRFCYDKWLVTPNNLYGGMLLDDAMRAADDPEALCNTVGCVAGWGAVQGLLHEFIPKGFTKADLPDFPLAQYAREYLGLDEHEAHSLFMGGAMIAAGLAEPDADHDDIMEHTTAAEISKLLRMIANDEVPGFRKPIKRATS